VAWYEDKETALRKSREGGRATSSPRYPEEGQDPSPQNRLCQGQASLPQDAREAANPLEKPDPDSP
jgi:hypothetical protein